MKTALVISGLPASGKTTLGKQLASALDISFLDKDDFLEQLFEQEGVGDQAWRQKLSRQSDLEFERAAKLQESVVLISHWRPPTAEGTSGTPTQWLNDVFQNIVEVFCDCPPDEAARRFATRTRHEGHGDDYQADGEITATMSNWAKGLPLGIGPLIRVDTTLSVSVADVMPQLEKYLKRDAS
ncbi:MAG: AAA family ATPase [Candidatus Phaeomarinobacter sp.]